MTGPSAAFTAAFHRVCRTLGGLAYTGDGNRDEIVAELDILCAATIGDSSPAAVMVEELSRITAAAISQIDDANELRSELNEAEGRIDDLEEQIESLTATWRCGGCGATLSETTVCGLGEDVA
jgi:hypothetical protein